ncbi:MAG: radical SAM protein [Desulfatitalea sp.]
MTALATLAATIGRFGRNRIPPQLVVQITNRCNARCPQCGMRRSADIARFDISNTVVERILDGCAAKGVQAISFTGGEPLLMSDDLVRWIDAAGKAGIPYIRTGTNGFLLCGADRPGFSERIKRLAERLAATPLRNFWISLDSARPEVHERMRGLPGVVAGIAHALPIFHAAGIYPSANLGLNRNVGGAQTQNLRPEGFGHRQDYLEAFYQTYRAALDRFYRFVRDLGFTIVNTCYPMSIDAQEEATGLSAVYAATALEDVVRYAADEKAMLYKALLDTIPRHRSRLRIFTPLSALHVLQRSQAGAPETEAFGCRGGVDFFFIDAQAGDTYPCGYRGNENLGKFWELDLNALRPDGACRRCDWECFRDPSELCAPFLQALHAPARLLGKMRGDERYRRLWAGDLRYYHACDLFDGRRPPRPERLGRFSV